MRSLPAASPACALMVLLILPERPSADDTAVYHTCSYSFYQFASRQTADCMSASARTELGKVTKVNLPYNTADRQQNV
jgi:hypothetical protein